MNIEAVKGLPPTGRLMYWIMEREKVRVAKEAGRPKPWTDDEILQSYRFCNVRRMDDKVSRWLLENWYTPYRDHPNMLLAVALARFINLPESLSVITKTVFEKTTPGYLNRDKLIKQLREYRDSGGNNVFNGAYMVRGNDGMDKIDCVVNYYVKPLCLIAKGGLPTVSMRGAWETILPSYGLGSFMAGQIVADLRWAVGGLWRDRNIWAPKGPGSERGLNRIAGRPLKTTLKQDEFLLELRHVIDTCKSLPFEITSRLEAHDYQNCLCEFDKYERTLFEGRRPKSKYPGAR